MPARIKRETASHVDALEPRPAPKEVVLHEGLALIEVSDEAELTALQADARLKDFILARLSPTEAVVLPQHSQSLLKALLKAGHTPKVS